MCDRADVDAAVGATTGGDTETTIYEAAERYRNWGRWGPEDQIGTLNHVSAEKIRSAAGLVRRGEVHTLALPFDANGPQNGSYNRVNPIHVMTFTPADTQSGAFPFPHGFASADDAVYMTLQCGTQWDGLSHIFDRGKMWNGYGADQVGAFLGAQLNGIEHTADRIVSRGVLLDVARAKGVDVLDDGYAITERDVLETIEIQGETARVGTGDIVLVRTGKLGACRQLPGWGNFSGGDSPGLSFFLADWLHRSEIAAIATDTWGVEVRPNELPGSFQPLHQVVIPNMGLTIGEIFVLDDLAAACAADGTWDFMFVAPVLPFTAAVGSPVNPQAIR